MLSEGDVKDILNNFLFMELNGFGNFNIEIHLLSVILEMEE